MGAAGDGTAVFTMTGSALILLLVPLWPGLLGLVALVCRQRRLGGLLAMAGAVPALGIGIWPQLSCEASYPWLLFGTRFGVGEADAVFLLFTAAAWILASGFAYGWIQPRHGRERFFALFLLTMSGNLGTLVAQDLPSFYALFALMSFSAYGLVVHALTREARHAANVYIVLVVIGEAALAAAFIIAAGATGADDFLSVRQSMETLPLRHLVIALAFLGFGIKAGVLILHVWLPLAHPVAPAPASAVLSGTIIVTGLVGWLRFLPVGVWALPGWGGLCVTLGLASAFYGAIIGTDQKDPKVVLAYSSISQMGIMTVGIGMMLLEPTLAETLSIAIAFFAMHHGLAKIALFLGAGLGGTQLTAPGRRWLTIGLALPSLALAGAPFTSGMVVKSAMVAGEAVLPPPWSSAVHFLLPLTSVATALLMARFLVLVSRSNAEDRRRRIGNGPWLVWGASLALLMLLPLWLTPASAFSWSATAVIGSLWPLGVALLVALIAIRIWRQAGRPRVPEIPAGDVLLPMERLMVEVRHGGSSIARRCRPVIAQIQRSAAAARSRAWSLIQDTSAAEALLGRWRVALTLALLLGVILALLSAQQPT
jgi:formate hydrogenlyase subunit 3/multisubunit Na+/H+ antiporter MnhD subunit